MDASSPIAPLTFTTALPTTVNTGWDVIATIPVGSSILTAFEIPSETGLAILDGTTLTWRQYGITLSDGVAVSLGYDGLVDSTTTGYYETVTGLTTPIAGMTSSPKSLQTTTTNTSVSTQTSVTGPSVTHTVASSTSAVASSSSSSSSSASASSSSSSSSGAQTLSAGKVAAVLLGALFAGLAAWA